jgi:hypothetical protein
MASSELVEFLLVGITGDEMFAASDAERRACEIHRQLAQLHDDLHDCRDFNPGTYPYVGCASLRILGILYADRPGYQQQWRPDK